MIGGSSRGCRLDPIEAQFSQIERSDEGVDHANRIALVDKIIEAFGQQRPLPAICLRNEALNRSPRRIIRRIIAGAAFSHTQGQKKPKIAGQQGDFTGLMFLRYLPRPPALPRSPDALPVGPSGRDAVGGGTIDQAEH